MPGRSPGWAWLALPPALAWFAGMGWGCLAEARAGTLAFGLESWHCALMITVVSTPMLLVMPARDSVTLTTWQSAGSRNGGEVLGDL